MVLSREDVIYMVPRPLQKLGGDSIHYVHTFSIWVIDVIGKIAPKVLNGHKYILMAIDYFTKWVEAASYSLMKAKHVT